MRAYFPFTFIVENQSYCCIWYSDSVDGFIMDADKIKHFSSMSALISYVVSQNLMIAEETTVLFVDGFTHWLEEPAEIDCEEFLMFWNVVTDLAHSSEFSFYGDHTTKILTGVYDKLFIGSQLPSKEAGNSLNAPIWDKTERLELTKVIEDGLRIIKSCL
ncbi:hypothetical protein [Paenibacillus psychroresistens]|nr:hypothetical protein [Paenibacillus psychroresistens]